jgi:DNA-binding transcriptional MerR regulator
MRLRFIRQAKDLGFTLTEIATMLRMHDAGQAPCSEVIAIAERHLVEVETEIVRLQRFRKQLASSLAEWRKVKTHHVPGGAICQLIERTFSLQPASAQRLQGQHAPRRAAKSAGRAAQRAARKFVQAGAL